MTGIFRDYIERDLERIPFLETHHRERQHDADCLISHVVVKNVFTDFDRQLSRLLGAVRGGGFPRFTVLVKRREAGAAWRNLEPLQQASVPHALRAIADRAISRGDGSGLVQRHAASGAGGDEGTPVPLGRREANALSDALTLCETIGEPEFLEISGDFEAVVCRSGPDQRPLTLNLRRGSVSIPNGRGEESGLSEFPIAGFRSVMVENARVQSYVASARHAVAAAKEAAVSEFRAAAEAQIIAFDRALSGRPLEGFLMESALSLVARLKAGLGDDLRGLSQHARITALKWSAAADSIGRSHAVSLAAAVGSTG